MPGLPLVVTDVLLSVSLVVVCVRVHVCRCAAWIIWASGRLCVSVMYIDAWMGYSWSGCAGTDHRRPWQISPDSDKPCFFNASLNCSVRAIQ